MPTIIKDHFLFFSKGVWWLILVYEYKLFWRKFLAIDHSTTSGSWGVQRLQTQWDQMVQANPRPKELFVASAEKTGVVNRVTVALCPAGNLGHPQFWSLRREHIILNLYLFGIFFLRNICFWSSFAPVLLILNVFCQEKEAQGWAHSHPPLWAWSCSKIIMLHLQNHHFHNNRHKIQLKINLWCAELSVDQLQTSFLHY